MGPPKVQTIAEWRVTPHRLFRRVAGAARGQVTAVHALGGAGRAPLPAWSRRGSNILRWKKHFCYFVVYVVGIDHIWVM